MPETEPAMTNRLPLIGEPAPPFKARTTNGTITFPDDYRGKWVILFSHPADFTPVCTTEFMTFASIAEELRSLNCELIGLSIDSVFSHIAWLRAIEERIEFRGMKGVHIDFPVIADLSMEVARSYGMIHEGESSTGAVRAVFFIDPKARVRALLYYPLSNGRNFDEIKRLLIAMQTSDEHKVATPADWRPGDEVLVPVPSTMENVKARLAEPGEGCRCVDWFLCFKQI